MLVAIIRIRGSHGVRKEINDTLTMMCLSENNHCVIYKSSPVLSGMLNKGKDYITWGPINKETLKHLLQKRGRLEGDKKITESWLKENKLTFDKFVDEFEKDPKAMQKLGLKRIFRLSPPSKGFGKVGIKYPVNIGGALGERKEGTKYDINILLKKMI